MQTAGSTYTATGDMSSVESLSSDALAAELAAAQAAMTGSRHNRSGLVYIDAKLAVAIFGAEGARRAAAASGTSDEDCVEYDDRQAVDVDFLGLFASQATRHAEISELIVPVSTLRVKADPTRQCGIECTGAEGIEVCTCECGGRNHGLLHRPGRVTSPELQAKAWARMPVALDDEPF